MNSVYDELSTSLTDARGATYFVFTKAHKDSYLAKLAPENFDEEKLREYYEEFNEDQNEESGKFRLDAISLLHKNLSALGEGKIIVLGII